MKQGDASPLFELESDEQVGLIKILFSQPTGTSPPWKTALPESGGRRMRWKMVCRRVRVFCGGEMKLSSPSSEKWGFEEENERIFKKRGKQCLI